MSNAQDEAAKAAIVRRFQSVATEYHNSLERQKYHQGQAEAERQLQMQISTVANDCHAAARLLGFDLVAALAAANQQPPETQAVVPPPQTQQIIAPAKAIRDVVLEMAQAAYPEPIRAKAVQVEVEKSRGPLHWKTIGMTLYRLSKEGLMRRKGQKDWFFVPSEERTKNPGAATPGLFNRDDEEEGNA